MLNANQLAAFDEQTLHLFILLQDQRFFESNSTVNRLKMRFASVVRWNQFFEHRTRLSYTFNDVHLCGCIRAQSVKNRYALPVESDRLQSTSSCSRVQFYSGNHYLPRSLTWKHRLCPWYQLLYVHLSIQVLKQNKEAFVALKINKETITDSLEEL